MNNRKFLYCKQCGSALTVFPSDVYCFICGEELSHKIRIPIPQVVDEIKSGSKACDVMQKYSLNTRQLQSLVSKLLHGGFLTTKDIEGFDPSAPVPPDPLEPESPRGPKDNGLLSRLKRWFSKYLNKE